METTKQQQQDSKEAKLRIEGTIALRAALSYYDLEASDIDSFICTVESELGKLFAPVPNENT